jgi:hypothetical protein
MTFSREPAIWVGIIGSVLTSAAALGLDFLNAGQAAAIVAFLSAVVIAVRTRPIAPAIFVGAFAALVALLAEYGLHASDAQVGFITSLILGGFALFGIRPQVSPSTSAGRTIEGQVVSTATVSR